MSNFVAFSGETGANFGKISKLIFKTFVWFVSRCEEKGIRRIDEWVQYQGNGGANAISDIFIWLSYLTIKVVFNHNIVMLMSLKWKYS